MGAGKNGYLNFEYNLTVFGTEDRFCIIQSQIKD